MTANSVINFPPAIYSSTFCLNGDSMWILQILIVVLTSSATYQRDAFCEDQNIIKPYTFPTISDYKNTKTFLKYNNWIEFDQKLFRLQPDIFVSNQSIYIQKLGLENKEIQDIDIGSFDSLFCVKILLVNHNKITDLRSEVFRGLDQLQELDLSYNELKGISGDTFVKLEGLIKLDLSYNKIKHLTRDSFKSLSNLWELILEHNKILDFPSNIFLSTPRLHRLFLSNNKISVITTPTFRHLENLDILDISFNGIAYIYEDMFKIFKKLTFLDISGNHFKQLKVFDLKMSLPMLSEINLCENSWECSVLDKIWLQFVRINISLVGKGNAKIANIMDIGCYNTNPDVTTVSPETITDSFPKDVNFFDDSNLLMAIDDVRSYVISTLVVVLIYVFINVMYKFCPNFGRSRGVLQFRESRENVSLPLLQR